MFRTMITVALAFSLAACAWYAKAPPEDVDKAAALFYQRLAEADYDAIYKDSAKGFKEKKTRAEIIESLTELAANGKVQNFARISGGVEGEGENIRYFAVYATKFEQRAGNLTLYFVDESGEWRLIGFAVKFRG
ncbi:MAG TPA: hypothetical protein VLE20_07690 [Blastocatellia bacterium]|nr:hypothetical protein [Blastocatellia bacterium]